MQAFFAGDEHGDLRAVFRFVEDLFEFVLRGVKGDFRLDEDVALPGERVNAIKRGRLDEGLETEEAVTVSGSAVDGRSGTDAIEFDLAGGLALEGVDAGFGFHIFETLDVDFAANDGEVLNDVFALGDDCFPGFWHDAGISNEDAAHGGVVVGLYVPCVIGIDGGEARVKSPDEHFEHRLRLGEIAKCDVDAPGGDTALDGDDEIVSVVGHVGLKEIDGAEFFAVELAAEDKLIVRVSRAEGVEVEEGSLAVVARVIEAGSIGRKGDGVMDGGRVSSSSVLPVLRL